LHFTPQGASWVNRVERFFAEITQKRIRRGSFTSVQDLERAIHEYLEHYQKNPTPFLWTPTPEDIFAKIKTFC
jgi:transposase